MKISVDDQELFTLSQVQKKVIMNDLSQEEFESDMKRRLQYVLIHKYEQCFKRLKDEWDVKLKQSGVKSIPTDEEEYANLVFSMGQYKSRSTRDLESKKV